MDQVYNNMFDAGCIKFGEFKLKSGMISPIYADLRLLASLPALLNEIGKALAIKAKEIGCDRLAAIPLAGMPIGTATSLISGIPMIYPRNEVKDHGTRQAIEGIFNVGDRVLPIDDLITDGGAKISAITSLVEAGLKVTELLVVLDREQGGEQIMAKAGYKLHSLIKLSELLDSLVESGKITSQKRDEVTVFIAQNQFT